jgi:hypothetical protein
MGGGPNSRCVGRVYGADGAVRVARDHPNHPNAATQHLVLLMIVVCARNISSYGYINTLPCCIKLAFHVISPNVNNTINVNSLSFSTNRTKRINTVCGKKESL